MLLKMQMKILQIRKEMVQMAIKIAITYEKGGVGEYWVVDPDDKTIILSDVEDYLMDEGIDMEKPAEKKRTIGFI